MTRAQEECTELLRLGDDGVWFCPKCGLRVSPKKNTEARAQAKGGRVSVCPHCGGQGYHIWAGSGQCPGMQEDKDNLKSLLVRAADALEWCREEHPSQNCGNIDLIDELRKAAE